VISDALTLVVGSVVLIGWSVCIGIVAPRLPVRWFERSGCGVSGTEARFEEALGVRYWKRFLPDAGGWFSKDGRKDDHIRNSAEALRRFAAETRRAELVHWCSLAIVPTFFLWCPRWVAGVLAGIGLLVNAPCLLALRYNRRRVILVLHRRAAADESLDR